MATEDHDFEEINYFKLDGKKYQWKSGQKGPVGDFVWDAGFKEFINEVSSFAPEFFLQAYQSSKTLSEAVRKYVHHLFGEKGLLVVDGNHPKLKQALIPVIKEDLIGHQPYKLATMQTQELDELGYKSQIYPREINLFYMQKGLRERVEKVGDIYKVLNTPIHFTEEQILGEIQLHPERFSPNVVLRPIYQELVLPNLAYLGGPAEVAYWLQLKSMFDHYAVPFPAVMPRNFAVILDQSVDKKIAQLGLSDEALFESVLDWKRKFVALQASMDFQMDAEKAELAALFQKKGAESAALEKSLHNAFEAGKVRALKILEQLSDKVRKAEEKRLEIQIRRRTDVQSFLYPGGSPQERTENMMRFYLSNPRLLEELTDLFDPFDFSYMILRTDDRKRAD
jgi:bacillithiol biosynthesis cysteine-adding enzyme BshC